MPSAEAALMEKCLKAWRFLYRNRLELRHWNVLEQDRVMLEAMEPDANLREKQYEHDLGLQRLRQHMQRLAMKQSSKNLAISGRGPSWTCRLA